MQFWIAVIFSLNEKKITSIAFFFNNNFLKWFYKYNRHTFELYYYYIKVLCSILHLRFESLRTLPSQPWTLFLFSETWTFHVPWLISNLFYMLNLFCWVNDMGWYSVNFLFWFANFTVLLRVSECFKSLLHFIKLVSL